MLSAMLKVKRTLKFSLTPGVDIKYKSQRLKQEFYINDDDVQFGFLNANELVIDEYEHGD